jgi:hypothetical protein
VDGDGSTVVGYRVVDMAAEGFRYDADGLVVLDGAHPSARGNLPVDITAGGQTVIGHSSWFDFAGNNQAARWNALGEVTHTGAPGTVATWISPDGDVALGYMSPGASPQAFDATLAVTASIPANPAYNPHEPVAASVDGSVRLLNRRLSNNSWESVIYESAGFQYGYVIPQRGGWSSQSFADMTPDGEVVVGKTINFSTTVAVTWSWATGHVTIPGLGDCYESDAVALADRADGLRVVGHCDGQAYVWDENGTTRIVADALTALGITLPANAWLHVADISADGRTLVGYYTIDYPDDDDRHAWIVRLGDDYAALP